MHGSKYPQLSAKRIAVNMKFPSKIKIDLLNFIQTGAFDYIKPGQTKEWILQNFPDPDYFSAEFLKPACKIWTYCNIEFHFDKTAELRSIFSDYVQQLDAGENIELDTWILKNHPLPCLAFVQAELNRLGTDYCKHSNSVGIQLITQAGVELGFSTDTDDLAKDPNQLPFSYFRFSGKQSF